MNEQTARMNMTLVGGMVCDRCGSQDNYMLRGIKNVFNVCDQCYLTAQLEAAPPACQAWKDAMANHE